jgi:hypothetical protein
VVGRDRVKDPPAEVKGLLGMEAREQLNPGGEHVGGGRRARIQEGSGGPEKALGRGLGRGLDCSAVLTQRDLFKAREKLVSRSWG